MLALLSMSFLMLFSTNTYAQGYKVQLAQQCNPTTGGTETMAFTGTFPNANGNGTLTIIYRGDLNSGGEILTFNGEAGPALGTSAFVTQCTGIDSVTYTIPMATINAWAATGNQINITAVADPSVNSGLTACLSSSSFCVTGRLSYPFATGPNDAGANSITPTIICPGTDTVKVQVNNYGTNQIDSVWVNWSKNGTLQTPIHLKTLLDTAAGTGSSSAIVSLGAHTFTAGATENFIVWTTMPNGVIDTTANNDSTSAAIKPSLTGVYTIGGTTPDYTTFALAIADLNTIGICGPIVFNVRQGTYNEQVDLGLTNGASSTNTITFQPDPANTAAAILTFASGSANNYVLQFSGAEYVTFDSLTITATGATYAYAVRFTSAENVTVKNCEINASSTSTSSLSIPIRNETGVNVEHCTIENNVLNYGYYGMYWYGGNTTTKEIGNVIKGNEIKNWRIYGMMFYYQGGGIVENNIIEQMPAATSTSYGLYVYYNDSVKIKANQVTLTGTGTNYGMYLYRAHGSATNKSEIQNNMISTSPSSTATTYGVYLGYGQHINFYHNSINCTGGSATGGRGIYVLGSTSTLYGDVDIKNNVFANSGLGVAAYVNSGATTGFLTGMDYNIYTASSGNILSLNGANNTLAAWTTATGLDSNSINAVPGFFSSTDLHLQGGVAADAGANVGVMVDIDGDARPILPSTGYDIGADEYIPPTCPVGYGTTSFNLTATSGDITWIPGANDTGWIVEYGPTGYTAGAGTSSQPSNDTTTISGLTPVTTYDVYIKGICGIGDTSLWMGPYTFTTRCVSSLNGLYTIDNTIPTGGINYNSFADAMNALNICGVSGPTTFHVNQGTYTEQVNLTSIIGSTPLNTVTFKADPTNTSAAIITYSANATANNYVLRFDGVENVVWDSLTINPTGATYAYGAYFPTTANNITIKNCEFNGNTNSTSSLAAVIYNQSGAANLTNNVTLDNNVINGGSYGVYWWGGGTTTKENNLTFTNNKVLGFRSYGTYFYYQDTVTIEDNIIKQATGSTSFGYAILSYYINNGTVKRNDIEMTSTSTNYGIMVGRYAGTSNEVSNNMIVTSSNQTPTGSAYGMYVNYALNTKIYHNSIHVRSGSPTNTRALYLTGSNSTLYGNNDIRNNIFVNSAGGFAFDATAGASNTTFLSHLDYNVYSSSGTTPFRYNNQTYANLTLHQAGSLLDSNSLYGNPGFIAGDDLHLLGAIAYDNGDATLGIMDDIDGDVRPLSPSTGYDIGADEYNIPSCPSPYSIQAGTSGTTNINVTWTNGPNDVSWELQYGSAGFTLGTGTIVSTTTNPVNVTGLTPSTCYQFWVRSICSVGDTSVWQGPTTICTDCAPLPDYCTDFESASVGSLPLCWTSFINTTATAAYIQTYGFNANSGTNCVRMYNQNDANATMMLIAPEVSTLSVGTHRANFWMRGDTTVTIGTMTNPTNPGTFTPFQTLQGLNTGSYTNFKVDFTGYTGTDTYIAFLWAPGATYDNVYIDDFCWEVLPSCEKAPVVTVLNPGQDSTTLRVGWNLDTSQTSFITAYGPSGYDPITNTAGGDTVTTPFNLQIVTGLKSLTEYCFWVKAICTNGDTSAWSGPHCGSTGCPDGVAVPYFQDFANYASAFPEDITPQCWSEANGVLGAAPSFLAPGESLWEPDGLANNGTTGAARMNVAFTNRNEWLISPTFNLGTNPNVARIIEFDVALTQAFGTGLPPGFGPDDTVALVVSYNKGVSWKKADIIMQWDTSNEPTNVPSHVILEMKNTSGYVTFGFYGASTISNQSNDFSFDNFQIRDTTYLGVDEISFNNNFKVYPNPNNGEFTIQNIGDAQQSSVKLMDIQGRVVYDSQYYFNENGTKQIKVGKLNAGVYLLLLQSDGKLEQHRIVIQ